MEVHIRVISDMTSAGVQSMRWLSSLQDRDIELLELMEQHKQLQVPRVAMREHSQPYNSRFLAMPCASHHGPVHKLPDSCMRCCKIGCSPWYGPGICFAVQ